MKTVLIVEDDPALCTVIGRWLESEHYETVVASSVEDAIAVITGDKHIDLALIDFWLGGVDALAIYDAILVHRNDLPILTMTGGGQDFPISATHAVTALSGARGFLQKPFRKEALLEAMSRLI